MDRITARITAIDTTRKVEELYRAWQACCADYQTAKHEGTDDAQRRAIERSVDAGAAYLFARDGKP